LKLKKAQPSTLRYDFIIHPKRHSYIFQMYSQNGSPAHMPLGRAKVASGFMVLVTIYAKIKGQSLISSGSVLNGHFVTLTLLILLDSSSQIYS